MAVARTHRPVWNRDACLPCQTCTRQCPTRVFPEQAEETDSLRGRVARKVGAKVLLAPPCQTACPLDQDVAGYIQAQARGDFDAALGIVLKTNPFPSVCARLCHTPCMRACVRGKLDTPVRIRDLKRTAVDHGAAGIGPGADRGKRVAVIGAGPSGLAAAFALRLRGFGVKVIEADSEPGGLLRRAVPAFHLPRTALAADIQRILSLGVEVETGRKVDPDEIRRLRAEGADAVIVAAGAGSGKKLGIPGEESTGCFDAVAFARRYAEGQGPALAGSAVVFGGGYLGAAAARMALRAGASPVRLLPGTAKRVPSAEPDGVGLAEEEGVEIVLGTRPVEIHGGKTIRCETPGGETEIEAAVFVAAQARTSEHDWKSLQDPAAAVFVAGEAATGPRNVVGSIARGMKVAGDVADHLGGPA